MPRRRLREGLGRLGLLVLGLVLGLVLLEVVLQVGAVVVRWRADRLAHTGMPAPRRILAVGDSNTYGVYYPTEVAYPAVLERLANDGVETPRVEVLNAGYPGTNSSRLRNALPELLVRFHPAVVTIMVGINDFWTVPEPVGGALGDTQSLLWRWSRVYRLLFIIERALAPLPTLGKGAGRLPEGAERMARPEERAARAPAKWDVHLLENLAAIVADVRAVGAEPVLLTYPSEDRYYREPNKVLRRAAAETGARLIDLGPVFTARCGGTQCDALFMADRHPNADGYALAGEILFQQGLATAPAP